MAVTVIKDLAQAALLRAAPVTIGELANGPGLSYRHPDSAQISYPRTVQTTLGSVPDGRTTVAIIGAGPGGIVALYELRQVANANPRRASLGQWACAAGRGASPSTRPPGKLADVAAQIGRLARFDGGCLLLRMSTNRCRDRITRMQDERFLRRTRQSFLILLQALGRLAQIDYLLPFLY